ncbi:MAG: TolC family protein [Opitutales bacterium]
MNGALHKRRALRNRLVICMLSAAAGLSAQENDFNRSVQVRDAGDRLQGRALYRAYGDLSLEEWLDAALERDFEVAEARSESAWESARADAVGVWEDPELRVGAEDREGRGDETSVRLRVPVPNPWEARAEKRGSRLRSEAERFRTDALTWERRMVLGALYFDAAHAERALELRTELLEGLERDLQAAEQGLEARALSAARVVDLRAERALTAARRAENVADWDAFREELRALAGWQDASIAGLSTPLPDPTDLPRTPPLGQLRGITIREHGEIAALDLRRREAMALAAGERAKSIPWISFLETTWQRESGRGRDNIEARIGISLPIFTWLRKSQTEPALQVIQTNEQIAALRTALSAALDAAWHKARVAEQRLETVFNETETAIRDIERVLETPGENPQRRAGLRDLRFDLESERLEAALDYQMALLDLMLVTGPGYPAH